MIAPPRFCSRCGSPVVSGAPFCPSCGSAVAAPVAPADPQGVPVARYLGPPIPPPDEEDPSAEGSETDAKADIAGCGRVIALLAGLALLLGGLMLIGMTVGKGDDPLVLGIGAGAALLGVVLMVGSWVKARHA